jgi:hypothetical protein
MNTGRTVFSQLIEYAPNKEFQKCGSAQESDDLPEKAGFLEKALWLA